MNSVTRIGLCLVLISFSTLVMPDMSGQCSMAGFYLELGCSPATKTSDDSSSTSCPEAFTCPDLHPDPNVCYYRGKPYDDRSSLPQSVILNPCSEACSCSVGKRGPRFDCAAVDCVETFDSDAGECVSIFKLDSCCRTGTVCGKDAIAKLKTCEVDGRTYYEGQTFEPANTRNTCICTPEWDGNVDNTLFCKDINCGIEIYYQEKLKENCAPIFYEANERSCPIGFQCPSPSTKLVRGLNIGSIDSECVFGNETMRVGDEVTADDKCMKCSCKVPPFVSCNKVAC